MRFSGLGVDVRCMPQPLGVRGECEMSSNVRWGARWVVVSFFLEEIKIGSFDWVRHFIQIAIAVLGFESRRYADLRVFR